MRIVQLVAGAAGMYCGSCIHGNTLSTALRAAGEDVVLVPVYTPLRTDEKSQSIGRVAFGALNVYLQQKSSLFRHTPAFVDRLLDRPGLLRWIGGKGGQAAPETLGSLTVSMLRGEEGRQCKELDKLIDWLAQDLRPDLVHLSNVMLVGMARRITAELGVPVVCSLAGEDVFFDKLPEPHYAEAREALRERAGEVAALVAMNDFYADFMADYLSIARQRISVIPPGLNLNDHGGRQGGERSGASGDRTIRIGYLSRICPEKGLHRLAQAFKILSDDAQVPPIQLVAAGHLGRSDRAYLAEIESQLTDSGLRERFQYMGELDRAGKIAFLQSLDVMSLPTTCREARGLAVLEAWANAVPVVVPDAGPFPELIQQTGGGLLHDPNDPAALARALKQMIADPTLARECGSRAQESVRQHFNAQLMAERTLELYRSLMSDGLRE